MTGYGQAAAENDAFRISVSARSVNHRFLDLVVRLAEEYREVETAVRQLIDDRLTRGRVEMRVGIEPLGGGDARVVIDREVVRAIQAAAVELAGGDESAGLPVAELLRMPEVVRVERRSRELGAEDLALVLEVTGRALDQLIGMREGEGAQLVAVLTERAAALGELADLLAGRRDEVRRQLLVNMRQRLAELLDSSQFNEDRLAQEIALLAEKMDVQEELDRLRAHLETFGNSLAGRGAVGRRLDFLAQEILRELNTLGSKCRDSQMAEWVVQGKLACEQLREQVQNVE